MIQDTSKTDCNCPTTTAAPGQLGFVSTGWQPASLDWKLLVIAALLAYILYQTWANREVEPPPPPPRRRRRSEG